MKGKVLSFKIVFAVLTIIAAALCFGLEFLPKVKNTTTVSAASTKVKIGDDEYSALFKGNQQDQTDDLIFSVEKVLVDEDHYDDSTTGVEKFEGTIKGANTDKTIYFKNIASGANNDKTVVDNGEFIILNNQSTGGHLHAPGDDAQEALIVSFGAYVYDGTNVTNAVDTTIYSQISYLNVSLEINGRKVDQSEMPDNRGINISEGGLYFDFVHVINQKNDDSNEGFYKYTINYMINSVEHVETFEFYVLNNISYTRSLDSTKGYNARPTLGWTGESAFEKSQMDNGYIRYKTGINGIDSVNKIVSYPTITYDYTKYNLSIKHTANQNNTTYTFKREYNTTLAATTAQLNYQINRSGKLSSGTKKMEDYNKTNNVNLVTIMLTEPGTYVINYDYIYDGYNSSNAPILGSTQEIKFAIHGLEANYSKTDFDSADLQYFEISTKKDNQVDLFVIGGHEESSNVASLKGSDLGFVYKLVENENREGDIVHSSSKDSLINSNLKDNKHYGAIESSYDFLVRESGLVTKNSSPSLITKDNVESLSSILNSITYVQTNQGSIWLEGNDVYKNDSVYWYSPTKITVDSLYTITRDESTGAITAVERKTGSANIEQSYTNTTTFNKKGYYIVFIKIDNNGMAANNEFWQVFAFQYTSSSVNINVEAILDDKNTDDITDDETQIVAGGKYTNKNVRISWTEPGIFDRAIKGYYYLAENKTLDRDQLLATSKKDLNEIKYNNNLVAELGEDVKAGSFVKYLIRLESEGEGATHKIFTIDRQNISNVQPYLIEEMFSGNHAYYAYSTDRNNNIIPINSSITNGYATISWDDKASGAETYASYNFTPFVQNSSEAEATTGVAGRTWITTNYELGTTLEGYNLEKTESIYSVTSANVLTNQGIYIIKIWDAAGNECYYSFIIDRTENYFQIGDSFAVNSYKLFGDDVNYSLGDSKVFELSSTNLELQTYIQKAVENKLNEFKDGLYYAGNYNNIKTISNYFQKVNGKTYFTVRNLKVVAFDTTHTEDTKITATQGKLYYTVNRGESYFKRTLFAIGENHTEFAQNIKNVTYSRIQKYPYITVEINKDNSLGMVYYSTSKIESFPAGGDSSGSVIRLDHGSDTIDYSGKLESGIYGAGATSANHVSFVWNMGTGSKFEVAKVSYVYYILDPLHHNEDDGNMYYFYSNKDDPVVVYNNGWIEGEQVSEGRGAVSFNGASETKPGLYVVTREYKNESGNVDFGEDSEVKNYYFIVDRNQVIDATQGIGSNIKLLLLENEVEFNNFSIGGTDYEVFSNDEDSVYNQRYNVYLTTTKLPATLNIPTGKYIDELFTSADYNSGKLNVSVYFNDIYGQLEGQFKNGTVKIYDSYNASKTDVYNINIYRYLTSENVTLRDRIALGDETGNWLFLSGDYIIRVTDNVVDTLGKTHEKFIGLRIKGVNDLGPKVDTYTGFEIDSTSKVIANANAKFTYSATVSQEYLKIEIPEYVLGVSDKAQIDPNYFVATQYYGVGSAGEAYINHPNKQLDGYLYNDYTAVDYLGRKIVEKKDGKISVWLDTKLRKSNGDLDIENMNVPLYYTIKVRYKIGDAVDASKYQDCYVYYDANGNLVRFYDAIYTIAIDREAPFANITYLNSQDAFVEEYRENQNVDEMLTNGIHETSSNLYFTKQYNKYYANEKTNKGDIFVYQVDETTPFDKTDVKFVFYKRVPDLPNCDLTLPMINEVGYTKVSANFSSYAGIGLTQGGYYEIIEQDAAGNTTQYIIHYKPQSPDVLLPISLNTTTGTIENYDIRMSSNGGEKHIYDLSVNHELTATRENAYYYKIEVKRASGEVALTLLTDPTTNWDNLNTQIVETFKTLRYGNFILSISTRKIKTQEDASGLIISNVNINMYDKNNVIAIQIQDLVSESNGVYTITLNGANKQNEAGNLLFFATEITVKSSDNPYVTTRYVGQLNPTTGRIVYTDAGTAIEKTKIECLANTTYYLTMTDVLGTKTNYRFNTNGKEFYNISFENSSTNQFDESYYLNTAGINPIYYGYTTALVQFDPIFTVELNYIVNGKDVPQAIGTLALVEGYYQLYINADYTAAGKVISARVDLFDDDVFEISYYITIDTQMSSVSLKDANSVSQSETIRPFNNVVYNDETVRSDQSAIGVLNLNWNKLEENSYFDYEYILHELKKDNTYVHHDLTNTSNYVVSTQSDSKGIYKFEIRVYGKDGKYLGNRIYAFEVQEMTTQIYYVRDEDGIAISANSSFKVEEFTGFPIRADDVKVYFPGINTKVSYPLYVSNQDLSVVLTALKVDITSAKIIETSDYKFVIYKLSKTGVYDIYLGILNVKEKPDASLVTGLTIKGSNITTNTTLTISGKDGDLIDLQSDYRESTDVLKNKNSLLLDIYYDNKFVKTVDYKGFYRIVGNGQYKFVIKDLAGNIHTFDNGAKYLEVYVLREVVVTINGEAPIKNGFYSDKVSLAIYASSKYVTGSISIIAEKNGQSYAYKGYNPYIFEDYGTYRVTISARYDDGKGTQGVPSQTVVTFTIVNVKEARKSIDLTALKGYEITKVLNAYGEDKTAAFKKMISNYNGDMNISYENVMLYENSVATADKLNVNAGKITFTLTYLVKSNDDDYPDRSVDFSFTLNNENPSIECSLGKGESTTKGFTISFNAKIMYEQIGEAYIYINDKIVMVIDENSENKEVNIETTFDNSGDGDYYVKIVGTSGVIWDSFKVTIKEPLNFWAIVVIIVIVGVVGTVVGSIVVLRRKMRIR